MRRWPDPLLYWPVILLEHVVQVFARIAPVRGAEISEVLRHKKEGHKTRDRSKRRDRSDNWETRERRGERKRIKLGTGRKVGQHGGRPSRSWGQKEGQKGGTGQIVGHCIPLASSAFKA
jgi:hypothetical protein